MDRLLVLQSLALLAFWFALTEIPLDEPATLNIVVPQSVREVSSVVPPKPHQRPAKSQPWHEKKPKFSMKK
jgi:hypothetical protein